MDEARRNLRRTLRAQAKQLGDRESQSKRGAYEIKHLVEKLAYDQWHRLLFARFLLENNLLISPEHGVSATLDDCEELAPSLGLKDEGQLMPRARFAGNRRRKSGFGTRLQAAWPAHQADDQAHWKL